MLTPSSNTLSNANSLHSNQSYSRVGLSSSSRSNLLIGERVPDQKDATQSTRAGAELRQSALEHTLSMGYTKLETSFSQSSSSQPIGKVFETGPLTAEKVAGNILGFIERRLAMDVAEGADREALASRLAAGLEGFKKGFAEAEQQLEALGMLNTEIKKDIGETYSRVIEGIDLLREKFLSTSDKRIGNSAENHAGNNTGNSAGKNLSDKLDNTVTRARSTLAASQYDYARANSFTFTLKTADGDSVRIEASSAEGFSLTELYGRNDREQGVQESYRLSASYSQSNQFNLQVKGELDAGELEAINELLEQVNNLAEDFFTGNLDRAFNAALELGYDSSEITRYSLSLTQVEVQRVASAYTDTGHNNSRGSQAIPALSGLDGVGAFAQDLLDAMRTAAVFEQPQPLILQLAELLSEPFSKQLDDEMASEKDNTEGDNINGNETIGEHAEIKKYERGSGHLPDFVERMLADTQDLY